MKPISWKNYYDKFYDWEESTQKNYVNRLSGFGPAEEVWEIAQEFALSDEEFASKFIQRALDAGVRFTPEQVIYDMLLEPLCIDGVTVSGFTEENDTTEKNGR